MTAKEKQAVRELVKIAQWALERVPEDPPDTFEGWVPRKSEEYRRTLAWYRAAVAVFEEEA